MKTLYRFGPLVCAALLLSACGGESSVPTPTPVVTPPAANIAPVLTSAITDQTARVGQSFNFDATQSGATFTDADGDTLAYSVSYAPSASGLSDSGGVNDGQSFADLLSSSTAAAREFTYTENADGWTVRNARYKLIEASDGTQNLFDLSTDPSEQSDLIGTASISAVLAELEANDIRGAANITGVSFSNLSPLCSDYAGSYAATANDIGRGVSHQAALTITSSSNSCTFMSNSLPNHDFNDGANGFPNTTGPVSETFNIPSAPIAAGSPTALTLSVDKAILLNGVKADVMAAACFGVGNEKTGCGDINQPWRFDPMHAPNGFNVDTNKPIRSPTAPIIIMGRRRLVMETRGQLLALLGSPQTAFLSSGLILMMPAPSVSPCPAMPLTQVRARQGQATRAAHMTTRFAMTMNF